jgi:hypothetical protein
VGYGLKGLIASAVIVVGLTGGIAIAAGGQYDGAQQGEDQCRVLQAAHSRRYGFRRFGKHDYNIAPKAARRVAYGKVPEKLLITALE